MRHLVRFVQEVVPESETATAPATAAEDGAVHRRMRWVGAEAIRSLLAACHRLQCFADAPLLMDASVDEHTGQFICFFLQTWPVRPLNRTRMLSVCRA